MTVAVRDFCHTSRTTRDTSRLVVDQLAAEVAIGVPSEANFLHTMNVHTDLTSQEAVDRRAIREPIDAYAHCADRRDAKG